MLIFKPIISKKLSKKNLMIASILRFYHLFTIRCLLSSCRNRIIRYYSTPMELIHWCDAAYSSCDRCSRRYYYRFSSIIYLRSTSRTIWQGHTIKLAKTSKKKLLALFGGLSVAVAGILSIFASAFPDGLDWSILQLTGSTELPHKGAIYSIVFACSGIHCIIT